MLPPLSWMYVREFGKVMTGMTDPLLGKVFIVEMTEGVAKDLEEFRAQRCKVDITTAGEVGE